MAARVLELADAVVVAIQAGWDDPAPATVSRVYLFDVPDSDLGLRSVEGRQVYVFPAGIADAGLVTRNTSQTEYRIAVLIVERYTEPGDPPSSWVDDRVTWVETEIWNKLSAFNALASQERGVWAETAESVSIYDAAILREHRCFWSEFEFAYREDA